MSTVETLIPSNPEAAVPEEAAAAQVKPPSLTKNFSWTFVGNIIYGASLWLMMTVLAKVFNHNPVPLGKYALGIAVAQPIIIFSQLQLRSIQATDARHTHRFGDYLALRLVWTGLALLILVGTTVLGQRSWHFGQAFQTNAYPRDTALVILIIGIGMALDSISDVIYGLVQQHERMDRIAISMMMKGPLALLGLGLGAHFAHNVVIAVMGWPVASLIVLLGYDWRSAVQIQKQAGVDDLKPIWDSRTLKTLTWLAMPLGITMMLTVVYNNVPRYAVEQFLGEGKLGILAALMSVIAMGKQIVNALGQSTAPRMAKYYAEGKDRLFLGLLLKLVAVSALLGVAAPVVAWFGGARLLTLLYTEQYSHYVTAFVLLLAGGGISYIGAALGCAATAMRLFKVQVPAVTGFMLVGLAACWVLVPRQGLIGAGNATIIASIAQVLIFAFVVVNAYRGHAGTRLRKS